jgi:hypothetical protein
VLLGIVLLGEALTLHFMCVGMREVFGNRLVIVAFGFLVVASSIGLLEVLGVFLDGFFDAEWERKYSDIFSLEI